MKQQTILIVEDDPIVARSVQVNLKRLGYDVPAPVDNAAAALEHVAATPPDLVLMDIRLKGAVDGIELAQRIYSDYRIPIIYTTGEAEAETISRAKTAQPYGYLVKPFGIKELRSAVEIAFYKHQMEQQMTHLNQVLRAIRNVNQLIVQEKDAEKLLSKACACLVETRGYESAWIAAFDSEGRIQQTYYAGTSSDFSAFAMELREGYRPPCWDQVLLASEVSVAVTKVACDCHECQLIAGNAANGRLLARLEHEGILYGIIAVVLPQTLTQNAEELALFGELAGDIAFSLHNIKMDIQRRRAQAAVAERERYLQLIIETTADGFFVINIKGQFVEVNTAYCVMSGYDRAELLNLHINDIDVIETPQATATRIQHIIAQGTALFETRHRRKDGSVFDVEISVTYLNEDGGKLVCFCRDISQRKREEAIMAARHRLLQLAATPCSLEELLRATVDEAEMLTASQVGFYHFVDADQITLTLQAWSTNTVTRACKVETAPTHYPISEAGVWVD